MKKLILNAPHWEGKTLRHPGEIIELTDDQYDWYVNAVMEARHAALILAEETVGTTEWVAKERSKYAGEEDAE